MIVDTVHGELFLCFVYKELVQFYLLVRYKNLVQIYRCSVRRVRETVPKHLFNSHCFLPDVDLASVLVFLCESIQQFRKFHLITKLDSSRKKQYH